MKIKRFGALLATSLLAAQAFAMAPAMAAFDNDACDFGSDELEVTLGDDGVDLYIDDAVLYCDGDNDDDAPLRTIDSITVEMDGEESVGKLTIHLSENKNGESVDWPEFATFDIDVTTKVILDGDGTTAVDGGSHRVTIGAKSVSFNGTTATSNAPSYEVKGSDNRDVIDGSKATVKLTVDGNAGADTITGGTATDDLTGGSGIDVIYGGAGNDRLHGDDNNGDQCWGQDGDDFIEGCKTAAPGAGDDEIDTVSGQRASYADLTSGIEWTQDDSSVSCGIVTGGAAGDDIFDLSNDVERIFGGGGDDVIKDECAGEVVSGGAGNDVLQSCSAYTFGGAGNDKLIGDYDDGGRQYCSDYQYGGPGNDVLRGLNYDDFLDGGGGRDKLFGGPGVDACRHGELLNSCNEQVIRN